MSRRALQTARMRRSRTREEEGREGERAARTMRHTPTQTAMRTPRDPRAESRSQTQHTTGAPAETSDLGADRGWIVKRSGGEGDSSRRAHRAT